ncbi:MAG: KilA-N domain-containing protein, partial [Ruthenibacterium sp.]
RDYADMNELVCLANLENTNSIYINEGLKQSERLKKLNEIAIYQMKILTRDNIKLLGDKNIEC